MGRTTAPLPWAELSLLQRWMVVTGLGGRAGAAGPRGGAPGPRTRRTLGSGLSLFIYGPVPNLSHCRILSTKLFLVLSRFAQHLVRESLVCRKPPLSKSRCQSGLPGTQMVFEGWKVSLVSSKDCHLL